MDHEDFEGGFMDEHEDFWSLFCCLMILRSSDIVSCLFEP